jgi:hypothetical protein
MKQVCLVLMFTAGILGISENITASEPLVLQVSPSVSMAPANVRVRARIEKNADNRGIEVAAESDDFYRSSYVSLDGDRAPFITEIAFKGLPGGDYHVSVVLIGSRGIRSSVTQPITIIESPEDGDRRGSRD